MIVKTQFFLLVLVRDYEDDWRNEAIEILNKLKFKGTVLNPTNKYYDATDKEHLLKQTEWEK